MLPAPSASTKLQEDSTGPSRLMASSTVSADHSLSIWVKPMAPPISRRPSRGQVIAWIIGVAFQYAMLVFVKDDLNRCFFLPENGFPALVKRLPLAGFPVIPAVFAVFDPGVCGVHECIGGPPCEIGISADQYGRQSGYGRPHEIAVGRFQDGLVPNIGQPIDLEMRIVGENRLSGGGPFA